MNILITGGAGYIGSHTVLELLEKDYNLVVIDNFSNSSKKVLQDIEAYTGKKIKYYQLSIENIQNIRAVFYNHKFDAVIHFAGVKAVSESVSAPLKYYNTNVLGTLNILKVMKEFSCDKIVFSSSATVYGRVDTKITEDMETGKVSNPYGNTKFIVEEILKDMEKSSKDFQYAILRYFNPIGAHKSGIIGENPNGVPNNIMPYITEVASNKREYLSVFGNDYNTKDGTGVRDYIHVVDLANAHIKALEYIKENKNIIANIGTGNGYSVLELIKTFEKVNKVKVPYKIVERRPGDVAICYADNSLAKKELNWKPKYTLEDMCKDSWNFIKN